MELEITAGIDELTTRAQVREIFEQFGQVASCILPQIDARDRAPGFVCFVEDSSATNNESWGGLAPSLEGCRLPRYGFRYVHTLGL